MELRRADLDPDPLRLFEAWFADAAGVVPAPEKMALATAGADGAPSARMVLMKEADERGVTFFSHTTSRKGRELAANPRAALLFYWEPVGRQVRIEGPVEEIAPEESDAYFATRPLGARVGALASRQSEPLESRALLEQRVAELSVDDPARPSTWGGFRVLPAAWEFWQHRDDRLHDRFRYTRSDGGWLIERLYP
ncbi:MAG TPA: pyridoxamine 5'-phosphate oxidase [Gaiellaceae bacterium]|nr:pyridoxamine 5'-phosphate oxidase [Gaiellaceae bacterium]